MFSFSTSAVLFLLFSKKIALWFFRLKMDVFSFLEFHERIHIQYWLVAVEFRNDNFLVCFSVYDISFDLIRNEEMLLSFSSSMFSLTLKTHRILIRRIDCAWKVSWNLVQIWCEYVCLRTLLKPSYTVVNEKKIEKIPLPNFEWWNEKRKSLKRENVTKDIDRTHIGNAFHLERWKKCKWKGKKGTER